MTTPRAGLLLVNLGTPSSPTAAGVRPYLREFLSDPRVITLPGPLRFLLVNGIIAPLRAGKSAAAYQSIWGEGGSPLLVHSQALAAAVAARLPDVQTELAMRYGAPSIEAALERFAAAHVDRIVVLPLYPQYSSATTGSTLERVMQLLERRWSIPSVVVVPPFYDDTRYLDAVVVAGDEAYRAARADHVLFSFHGLPEDHIRRGDPTGARCLASSSCCDAIVAENRLCYRAQCFATARGLAARLGLDAARTSVSFQSRLGRAAWVRPYTDDVVLELAQRGVKRLAVFCPAFVADCLETLEEIGERAREAFRHAGGEELILVPCPNAAPAFVDAIVSLVRANAGGWLDAPGGARAHDHGTGASS